MTEFTAYDELMPKIQALIGPGDSLSNKDKSSNEHHFFKRKGKWHNHDCCDACGEKGKLLCCDICPASFHLLCHDPPLDVAHVPNGPWTCYACNNIRDKKNDPSRKSYKIEFVNGNSTSAIGLAREKKNQNSWKNTLKKGDLLPKKSLSLLYVSLCKTNSAPLVANSLESASSKSASCDSVSASTFQDKSATSIENLSKLNLKCRPGHDEMKRNNGNASINMAVDQHGVSNICDIEIKTELEIKEAEGSNSNGINLKKKKHNLSVVEPAENSKLEETEVILDANHVDCQINLMNCDFVLNNESISCNNSEARISSLEKSSHVKNSTSGSIDRHNVNGIEKVFSVIIGETKKLNPRQFVLPKEYITDIDENLLKSEKDVDSFTCDWDSNDLLKIPARRCYFCKGICLSGQMISCDFCPAHFHLNCLDPPMCSTPDVKWMCPLHPHHILEKVMDNPDSITELTTWWSDFSNSIDSKEVISKFVKKINRQKKTVPRLVSGSVKIPDIVKYHYKNPVRHIPELKDLTNQKSACIFEEDFTLVPHDLIMKSNECCSRQKLQSKKSYNQSTTETVEKLNIGFLNAAAEEEPVYSPQSLIEITNDDKEIDTDSKLGEKAYNNGENLSTWDPESRSFRFKSYGIYDLEVPSGIVSSVPIQNSTQQPDKSPWEKIEEIVDRNIDDNLIFGGSSFTKLNSDLKRVLINEELQSIVKDLPPSFLPDSTPYPFTPPFMNNNLEPKKNSSSKVHAVLCPLSHRAPVIFIYDDPLSIGTDFSNDVCLLNYGYCNFISSEHAIIFFDKPSQTYELLNYSEYVTVVDGIAYTCDISCRTESKKINLETSVIDKISSGINDESTTKQSHDFPVEKIDEPVEKWKPSDSTSIPVQSVSRTKPSGLESRNLFKKLMTDIDKLILKSKKEMATIAEDDLNEIAKAVKASADTNKATKESAADKQKLKKKPEFCLQLKRLEAEIINNCEEDSRGKSVSKENHSSANSTPSLENDQRINDSCEQLTNQTASVPATVTPSLTLPETKETKSNSVLNQTEVTTLRRSERKIKRSIFATYRREMRKDKKLELNMLGSDSEDEVKIVNKKKAPPPVTTVEDEPTKNENQHPNDGRYVPETREMCRCQVNNVDLPDGMDSSWENSAALRHGSHIRFGCIEFVFSIVNYTTDFKNRSYQQLRKSPPLVHKTKEKGKPPEEAPPVKKAKKNNEEDLSSKLRSLLNVLSSTKSSPSRSSNSSVVNSSPRSSPESSRSPSPNLSSFIEAPSNPSSLFEAPLNPSSLIEINHEESDHIRHEIKAEDS